LASPEPEELVEPDDEELDEREPESDEELEPGDSDDDDVLAVSLLSLLADFFAGAARLSVR
jgi:hypothetical protein